MRKLPGRLWRLPRHEDDEAAEEGIGRILALSDGVFAIALTLLVLEIAVPATTSDATVGRARARALRAQGLSVPVVFALTLPVAAFAPYIAEILWFLVFPLTRIAYVWFISEEHRRQA